MRIGLASFSPAIALALASARAMRIGPLGVLDLGVALEARRLLADLLLLVQFGQAHGLLALGFAGADLAQLVGVGHLDDLVALGLGHADLAQSSPARPRRRALAASPAMAAFWPMASM